MSFEIIRDMHCLHPIFRPVAERLAEALRISYQAGDTKTNFKVFESYRHPLRQNELLARGATKAGPWESAHNYGLACDFVPYLTIDEALSLAHKIGERVNEGWNWHSSHDWSFLDQKAREFGLSHDIKWDQPHVQSPHWQRWRKVVLAA